MVSRYGHLTCASDKPVPEQPGPARDSLSSLCLMTRAGATWHQALPNSLNPLKSHFCAEKGKKAYEGGTGGGWYCGPAEILGEKRDWPLYQTWLQLVIRRKESFFVQLTHSEPWVGPVYRQGPVSDDTLMLGEERQEAPVITRALWWIVPSQDQARPCQGPQSADKSGQINNVLNVNKMSIIIGQSPPGEETALYADMDLET